MSAKFNKSKLGRQVGDIFRCRRLMQLGCFHLSEQHLKYTSISGCVTGISVTNDNQALVPQSKAEMRVFLPHIQQQEVRFKKTHKIEHLRTTLIDSDTSSQKAGLVSLYRKSKKGNTESLKICLCSDDKQ